MTSTRLLIGGPAGALQACLDEPTDPRGIALLCHAHPLYGGSLDDAVLVTAADVLLQDLGCACLRFNFRGVGGSGGRHDDGRGEIDDARAACAWLRERHPTLPLLLLGYSFGARIAWAAAADCGAGRLSLIAPPVERLDFGGATPPDCSVSIIVGGADPYAPADAVSAWANALDPPAEVWELPGVDHFFQGGRTALAQALRATLT